MPSEQPTSSAEFNREQDSNATPYRVGTVALLASLGCSERPKEAVSKRFVKLAKVRVNLGVLDKYVGTYQLPNGVLFRVSRDGERLMAGTPPAELLPQTTRQFASNHSQAIITFERDASGAVPRLNYQLAQRDLTIQRVDATMAKDPTVLVEAGDHRVRMLISGEGGPTVVVEDGFGSSIEMQSELHSMLCKFVRVVTYDHAGTGGSEPGPMPRDGVLIAKELRLALRNAGVAPPFLLVGSSIGGDYIRIFADQNPKDIIGITLLDPTPDWEELDSWMTVNSPKHVAKFKKLLELVNAAGDEMMGYQEPGRQAEWAAMSVTREQARQMLPPPNIAFTQIIGAAGMESHRASHDKVQFFQSWLDQHIPHGRQVLATNSGHAVFFSEPQLVVREIRRQVNAYRRSPASSVVEGGVKVAGTLRVPAEKTNTREFAH